MIAMVRKLRIQKKTETELVSPAALGFGESFYYVLVSQESSLFCYPQLLVLLYHNGP